jgi:hypothetical protein
MPWPAITMAMRKVYDRDKRKSYIIYLVVIISKNDNTTPHKNANTT